VTNSILNKLEGVNGQSTLAGGIPYLTVNITNYTISFKALMTTYTCPTRFSGS